MINFVSNSFRFDAFRFDLFRFVSISFPILQVPDKYAFVFRHVVKHGVESGVTFGVNFEVFFFSFFFILFKMAFVSFTKIVIIIFCLLKVLFDGLTTLKSMGRCKSAFFAPHIF